MNLFALDLLHIGDYKNINDSNVVLYIGPDSSFKGPILADIAQLVYSAEEIQG